MLFILRQLRRSFFLPGKLRTYLAYAIGEILLIVIGILIAVQIGDWKEARKLDRQREELIENLKADFQTNLERLENGLGVAAFINGSMMEFLRVATNDNSHLSIEELRALADDGIGAIMFRPAMGVYQSATADGSISLIGNPALTDLFLDFEQNFSYYLINQNADRHATHSGEAMALRRRFGSIATLLKDRHLQVPESFALSDQEYREAIAQKEVYAFFELIYRLQRIQEDRLKDLKANTLDILAALEEL